MLYAVLVLALVGLDQLVKFLVRANIPLGGDVPFLPHILQLTYVQNTGAAFSILSGRRLLLTLLPIAALGLLLFLYFRRLYAHPLTDFALPLIMGGALGNLVDRVRFRAVVDFLDVYWGDWHWPAFNVADSAIFVGAVLACLILWRKPQAAADRKDGKPTPGKGGTA